MWETHASSLLIKELRRDLDELRMRDFPDLTCEDIGMLACSMLLVLLMYFFSFLIPPRLNSLI